MRANAKGVLRPIVVAALFMASASWALAAEGRNFMGYYDISNVSSSGNQVQVTLQLKIFNNSKSDIQHGAVALYTSEPTSTPLGGFNAMKLFRAHHDADLARQFTIPKREFDRWQHGAHPALFFLYQDAQGRTLRQNIDLVRRPMAPIQSGQ